MHVLNRDDCSAAPRNSEAPVAESGKTAPTPPEGGWSAWYLTDEDDVGESTEQGIIVRLLLAALTELARERGWARSLAAGDQFFAWIEHEPLVRVSPDVYLLDDPPAPPYPASWQVWRPGHPSPRFAVEVVSADWRKDYDDGPHKYDQLGAHELVLFDPDIVATPHSRRVPLQVFRRGPDGALTLVAAGPGPVHSAALDVWLVIHPDPAGPRLRLARDPAGADLVHTAEEKLHTLEREHVSLRRENAELRRRLARVEQDNADLRRENADLRRENAELRRENAELRRENAELKQRYAALETKYAALETKHADLEAKFTALEAVVARLLARP
ncbi:MAG: Uma2 family endonuclease [Myxococcales bacterium]|nr:Uma2 family endonuclease [Myxococcales bacterium]